MELIKYDLRIENQDIPSGEIDIKTMNILCELLMKASKRSLSFFVDGISYKHGRLPDWINESSNYVITGLKRGSTVVEIGGYRIKDKNQ